jgi:hypothetical protein
MTDEQYGRAWAKAVGVRAWQSQLPDSTTRPFGKWFIDDPSLPDFLERKLFCIAFKTESDAFAALGAVVRDVHRMVPTIPEPAPDDWSGMDFS